jgi:hypothetical protein
LTTFFDAFAVELPPQRRHELYERTRPGFTPAGAAIVADFGVSRKAVGYGVASELEVEMNESNEKKIDLGESDLWLKDLVLTMHSSPEVEQRHLTAARAAHAIDLMRKAREHQGFAALPLDRYLRGLAEVAGVSLDEVLTSLGLSPQDRVTAATAPLLARVARLIGLPADETLTLARLMFVDSAVEVRLDAIVGRNPGARASAGADAHPSIDEVLQQHEKDYSEVQRAELGSIEGAIKSEYTKPYQFDIALSFAGEDRQHAKTLAALLRRNGVRVFYDENETASLWGKDLYQLLAAVYRDSARYCVVFVSATYATKLWTRHELKQVQARAFREREEYLLPLRLDDTELEGVNSTIGYIDLRQTTLEKVAQIILDKLSRRADWSTWPNTPTDISEFSSQLRVGVDTILATVSSAILHKSLDSRASIRDILRGIRREADLDLELTCLDSSGVFVYHPWPDIVGRSLASQWSTRAGFAEWVLLRIREMGRGYLTWKDQYASDPDLEMEIERQHRPYVRRTLLGFRRLPFGKDEYWAIAVEGHEIVTLGPLSRLP